MTDTTDHDADLVKRLRAPAYWMSGSDEGHEGDNTAPLEAADAIERYMDEHNPLYRARAEAAEAELARLKAPLEGAKTTAEDRRILENRAEGKSAAKLTIDGHVYVPEASSPAIDKAIEALTAYETWEANLIMCPPAWQDGEGFRVNQNLYDEFMAAQALRNAALSALRGQEDGS